MKFDGQLALVTGASKGIGSATAIALAKEGAHVIITARSSDGLEKVEEQIHEAGGNATIAPLDLTDGDSIGRLASAISERWEALDILILNAAMLGSLGPVAGIDGKEFNNVLTLNLLSQQALIAGFDSMLRKSENARLLAITSSVAKNPRPFWGAYASSKAALENLVLSYGEEMRNLGKIRTAIIDPVRTRTDMRAKAYPGEDPMTLKTPYVVADRLVEILASDFDTGEQFVLS
ncbi:MAG: SDR family NAD(P)-dependent oxidoreductase [Parasphingorhabdus sp.]